MASLALHEFIGGHRNELIRRCQAKVSGRASPPHTKAEVDHGVPLFLDQLCQELRAGSSQSAEIGQKAKKHGHDLLLQGFSIEQVVHDYGDVCQSVTDLALELAAPISVEDFRTLNRCLDDAIAGAVTEFTSEQGAARDLESDELRNLTNTAIVAFEAIAAGKVGLGGNTSAVLRGTLMALRAALALPSAPKPEQDGDLTPTPAR
jgi:hypothetical protein